MAAELTPTKTTEGTVVADSKAQRAHEKRLGGFTWQVVADEFGYASSEDARLSVQAYLQRSAMRLSENTRREMLDRELDRLDTLQSAVWEQALQGDYKAIEISLKIIYQRSKLLGLEAISTTNVTNHTIVIPRNNEDYVKRLQAIAESA